MPFVIPRLSSRRHALVTECRTLARGTRDGRVLLEGAHLLHDALAAHVSIDVVLGTAATLESNAPLVAALQSANVTIYEVTSAVLEAASPAESPGGVVAIARWAPVDLRDTFSPAPALVVALIDVQDPGNVGAVVRTADALGATGVALAGQSADPGGWKALRGSMGSAFRLPVARTDVDALFSEAKQFDGRMVAAVPRGGSDPINAGLERPTVLLLGHEGTGLPAEVARRADARVTVPMRAAVESINVSVAAALLVHEARRQRTAGLRRPSVREDQRA